MYCCILHYNGLLICVGVLILSNIVALLNVQTRFKVDDDTWPHYEGHRNLQQAIATTKLTQTGNIASLASNQPVPKNHSNYQPLKEVLDTSIVTKEVEQILAPLEKNDEPQFILIEGPPGIGKSVLLKEIAYRWGDKQVLKGFKFVFLVCLRDPTVQQITSVHDLLQLSVLDTKEQKKLLMHATITFLRMAEKILFSFWMALMNFQ